MNKFFFNCLNLSQQEHSFYLYLSEGSQGLVALWSTSLFNKFWQKYTVVWLPTNHMEHFPSRQQVFSIPLIGNPPFKPRKAIAVFLPLYLPLPALHTNRLRYVVFCVCLLSLSLMLLRVNHECMEQHFVPFHW